MDGFEDLNPNQLLELYLTTADEARSEAALSLLLDQHATSRVKSYFKRKVTTASEQSNYRFTRSDAEDLASRVVLELLAILRERRGFGLADAGIDNFEGYLNAICNSIHSDFWRSRFADFYKLQNRIRYLFLRRDSEFAYRRNDQNHIICYAAGNADRRSPYSVAEIVDRVKDAVDDYPLRDERVLVGNILDDARGWVPLKEIVGIVADLRGVKDMPPQITTESDEYLAGIPDGGGDTAIRQNHLYELGFLWNEIKQLPRFQRLALLYNLRDHDGKELNCVWFESGVATLAEIATAFEKEEQQMADLLVRLPFSDSEIAEMLGIDDVELGVKITRKETKVGNLRKVARAYLQRRVDGKQTRKR